MPRRTTPKYLCKPLEQLARQLLFAPEDRRTEQLIRSERLHDEIDDQTLYPLEFIVYRITGYRSEYQQDDLLMGQAARHDLRLLIDQISYSITLLPGTPDRAHTGTQLAELWNVSTKTLSRWRQLGLRWRWETPQDGPGKYVVYPHAAVAHFQKLNAPVIHRAGQYTHIPEEEKTRIIRRAARLLSAREISPHELARHLARRTGRAVETLRLLLLKHDELHPEAALFRDRTKPLSAHQKRVVERAWRMGVPMHKLCKHFDRTRATLHRVIHEARANRLRHLKLTYRELPTFAREDADAVYLRPLPVVPADDTEPTPRQALELRDLPESLHGYYAGPLLSTHRQQSLLVRLHYLQYRSAGLIALLDRYAPRVHQLNQIESWQQQAGEIRRLLLEGTAPQVLSVVRRHMQDQPDAWTHRLLPLLQEARKVHEQCLDQYDITGKTTFEAYLTFCLMRHLAGGRAIKKG